MTVATKATKPFTQNARLKLRAKRLSVFKQTMMDNGIGEEAAQMTAEILLQDQLKGLEVRQPWQDELMRTVAKVLQENHNKKG